MTRTEELGGLELRIDEPDAGAPRDTVLLLHGWPDTAALWDGTVAALSDAYRCLRFTLPGFGPDDARAPHTLAEIVGLIERAVQHGGGGKPVTLVLHDWGCLFGYHFARLHPALVSRVVGVDIGDAGSRAHRAGLSRRAKWGIATYQLWLALAWRLGGALGDRMARSMAARMRVPVPNERIHARMGYPYWITWTGAHGSYKAVRPYDPPVPMLFIYGRRKPFLFQSRDWTEALAARPGSRVVEMPTGHWVMVDAPAAFQAAVRGWLDEGTLG